MGALSQYYVGVFFLFLLLLIINFMFFVTYSEDICWIEEIDNSTTPPKTSKVEGSTHLTTIPIVLVITHAGILFFILFGICGIRCFSNMAPEKYVEF